ncbi:MAG: type II toxin-antitoxin system HicB family antitoxin [Planctomycetota bacterium]|jgi:predicted RNase H-like HicB family nuclease|nr:type II toxin-antitoxin system HicB family antitoxin [Planctomycetota bacterium]
MHTRFNVIVTHEPPWYVAKCVDNQVASQGRGVEEAVANLREALTLYYEDENEAELAAEASTAFLTTVEVSLP